MEGEERRRGWIHPPLSLSLSLSHFFSSYLLRFQSMLSCLVGGLTLVLVTYQHITSDYAVPGSAEAQR